MKKISLFTLMTIVSIMGYPQTRILLTTGVNTMSATLVENDATRELKALLEKGSITVHMSDYGGFEKVGALPQSFTTSNSQISTEPGDIMLYQGSQMVIFYGTNSWSYTPLGKIDGATSDNIKKFLGNGDIELTISLDPSTGLKEIPKDSATDTIFDLNGNRITEMPPTPGIYVVNGKKIRL